METCESLRVRELCCVCGLVLCAVFEVLKNGLRQNIIFAREPRGEAPRQAEEEAAHVSTSATHTFKGRGSYLSLLALLSFPS